MTKEEILEFIGFNKKTENEEIFSITKDCYILMAKIILHFGFKDNLYKEPLLLLKDYMRLIKKEIDIYDYIIINLDNLDLDKIANILENIDILHDKAYNRLDKDLADMETALDINDQNRIRRSKNTDLLNNYNESYSLLTTK